MKTYHSNKIRVFDIFFAEKLTEFGKSKHYYVCVYSQKNDINHELTKDIIGLMITSNPKYENIDDKYNVKIEIAGKPSWVCCDKLFRFNSDKDINFRASHLTTQQRDDIKNKFNRFLKEINRQMRGKII